LLVREGCELGSARCMERLSTGALLEELHLDGERLHYRRLSGSGPESGWISIRLEHKDLARRVGSENEAKQNSPEAPDASDDADMLEDVEEFVVPDIEEAWEVEAEHRALSRLPMEVSSDLKWFVWNQIWRRLNGRFAAQARSDEERVRSQNRAQEDAERMNIHLRAVEATKTLTKKTLRHIKKQAELIGDTVAASIREQKWLQIARVEALALPGQFEHTLWSNFIVALRSAGMAVFFTCRNTSEGAETHKDYFEMKWVKMVR